MDPILELATELGKRLSEHPRVKAFRDANSAVSQNLATRQVLADYETQAKKIEDLQVANKPIEPEDKRRLVELEQKMASDPLMKNLLKAQMDYVDFMRQVNEAIQGTVAPSPPSG